MANIFKVGDRVKFKDNKRNKDAIGTIVKLGHLYSDGVQELSITWDGFDHFPIWNKDIISYKDTPQLDLRKKTKFRDEAEQELLEVKFELANLQEYPDMDNMEAFTERVPILLEKVNSILQYIRATDEL